MREVPQGLKRTFDFGAIGSAEAEPFQNKFGTSPAMNSQTTNACFEGDGLQAVRRDASLDGGFSRRGAWPL